MKSIKGTYKVNDKIKVTGLAKAYAGNNIDGASSEISCCSSAKVSLSMVISVVGGSRHSESWKLAHGETKTDKDGKFIVEFTAIPDLTIDKKLEPVFDYNVYADVTDINGETRSGEQMSIGKLQITLLLKTVIPASASCR